MNICAKFGDDWIIFRYRNRVRYVTDHKVTESQNDRITKFFLMIDLYSRMSKMPTKKVSGHSDEKSSGNCIPIYILRAYKKKLLHILRNKIY